MNKNMVHPLDYYKALKRILMFEKMWVYLESSNLT
jgi:hypothetical protein